MCLMLDISADPCLSGVNKLWEHLVEGIPILPYGGGLHFAFLARAARMLQTASGDDPKIAQNSNTSKIASGRPRIAPRRLQDGQDAQTDPNRTPKTTPNKPPNRRNIKVNCDMMIVQKTRKSS